ncbi:hypothetical protein BTUL_0394g00050 [Botrytis tulipae]|uniref:Uncharacterized protein n=1 Tax=Botrytis tulipae TaxID=87230 RepID=A0A4Z1E6E6_9HELO|nr:hypothetical protein BTUL_0394g00050 [Botrytis tulipae]
MPRSRPASDIHSPLGKPGLLPAPGPPLGNPIPLLGAGGSYPPPPNSASFEAHGLVAAINGLSPPES